MKPRFVISTICLVAAAVLAVATLVFTHLPDENVPRLIIRIGDDKLRHVLSYGLFSTFLFMGLRPWLPNSVKVLAWVALIGTTFSIVDELTQPLTGRTCSLLDFVASFGGTLLGGSVALIATVLTPKYFRLRAAPEPADTSVCITAHKPMSTSLKSGTISKNTIDNQGFMRHKRHVFIRKL